MWTIETLKKIRLSESGKIEYNGEDGSKIWALPLPEEVLEWFALLEAGWVYSGDPARAHAILHSGKHSNGFFLCKRVLKFGNLRRILAACMVQELRRAGLCKVDGVFGAPYSSITLAADVGELLGVPNYIVEKGPKDEKGKDTMVFKSDDPIPAGSTLLRIEELITTLDSCTMATNAIVAGNPNLVQFASYIGALVYRPPVVQCYQADGSVIVPFIEKQVDAHEPDKCPWCAAGSKPVYPKKQWGELVL